MLQIYKTTDEGMKQFESAVNGCWVNAIAPTPEEIQKLDAFASIISNNLNTVMKALAAITIVINVPAVVASFYGMNVTLPGQEHPFAFLFVFGLSFLLTAIAVFIFAKRDWF